MPRKLRSSSVISSPCVFLKTNFMRSIRGSGTTPKSLIFPHFSCGFSDSRISRIPPVTSTLEKLYSVRCQFDRRGWIKRPSWHSIGGPLFGSVRIHIQPELLVQHLICHSGRVPRWRHGQNGRQTRALARDFGSTKRCLRDTCRAVFLHRPIPPTKTPKPAITYFSLLIWCLTKRTTSTKSENQFIHHAPGSTLNLLE
jgi:hypothetical protein